MAQAHDRLESLTRRYAAFIYRHRRLVAVSSLIVAVAALVLVVRLPVRTDTSVLLPPNDRSVIDLLAIEKRAKATGTLLVLLTAPDPAQRVAAAAELRERLHQLHPALVSDVVEDDLGARRWGWDQRFLFAPLPDLEKARDALRDKIEQTKLELNPAYVNFDDEPASEESDKRLDELKARWNEAEAAAKKPPGFISADGKSQLLVLRTPIAAAEVSRGGLLDDQVKKIAAETAARFPGVDVGVTGDVHTARLEQKAILGGMVLSTVLTVTLVTLGLWLYFRSLWGVAALLASLGAGVLATFGWARIVVGHLNSVSAFLGAIVIGVGIDFGIIFLARGFEELRAGHRKHELLARAISGSAPGTFAAACAVGVAYAALMATQFRGFREFGVIGVSGMALCWLAAYTTLPALLAIWTERGWIKPKRESRLGAWLARLLPVKRLRPVAWIGLAITAVSAVVAWRYLESRPFEHDWQRLRSTSAEARLARRWYDLSNREFGTGISGAFVIAAPSRDDARAVAATFRAAEAPLPPKERRFGRISVLDDLVPADQDQKLPVLAEIRRLLDDKTLQNLDADKLAELKKFRPPDDVRKVTDADLPPRLADVFVEKDGSRGRLLYVTFGPGVRGYDADSLASVVDFIRALDLPPGVQIGGTAFVFTDITRAVERDAARATFIALAGVALFVLLLVGGGRHAMVTLVCVAAGTLIMIAGAALLGIRVNFLDFAALPLTLGISVDYSVNIVARHRLDLPALARLGPNDPLPALVTTGGAVLLCSYTTIIGYGSLALSDNAGIRSFGLSATLGELACLAISLTLCPALLWIVDKSRSS